MVQMSKDPAQDASATGFDLETMIAFGRHSLLDRVGFAAMHALLSLFALPWPASAGWLAVIIVWEWVICPPWERAALAMPKARGFAAYGAANLIASAIYSAIAVLGILSRSPVGLVLSVTWLAGSFLNVFTYASGSRTLMMVTLAPMVAASVFGPWLAFGPTSSTWVVPILLGLFALAAQRSALDRTALLEQLADRKMALLNTERKLSLAVEASGDGLFEIDLVADQFRPNATWRAMLGYGEEDPTGDWRSSVHPEDLPRLAADYAAHFSGATRQATSEIRLRCKDGGFKWVLSRGRLVSRTADGAPWVVVGTTIDISVRKILESQLEAARDHAESSSQAKSAFLATMSHEIRTPLNGVLGMAQAMAANPLPPAQRERLDVVRESGESLLAILNDMLDLSKIEAGKLELEMVEFDLGDISRGAYAAFTALANKKGLSFSLGIEHATGVYIGDPTRIRQVLYNLISNALKFTEHGEIRVTMEYLGGRLVTTVADTGIGMSPEAQAGLFNTFTQADTSTTRRFGGTGLGLSICRRLGDLMGGSILVASQEGEGSTFTFDIPLQRVGEARRGGALAPELESHERLDIRVMAAEDNRVNQLVLTTLLHQIGVTPLLVDNGERAVQAWEAEDWDVILMDIQMPVMDGPAAVRAIRAQELQRGRRRTPIIALTANAMNHQIADYLACGMDGFVAKPIEASKLFEALSVALTNAEA